MKSNLDELALLDREDLIAIVQRMVNDSDQTEFLYQS